MDSRDEERSRKGKKPPKAAQDKEIQPLEVEQGVNAPQLAFAMPFYAKSDEEKLVELLRQEVTTGPTISQLQAMRMTDGQARGLYRIITEPIQSALQSCSIAPVEGGEEEAKFIEDVFFLPPSSGGMTITFHRFATQMLQALFDGFAAFEKVYWMPKDGKLKGKVTLKKLAYRPPETITFITNEDGSFRGFRQQSMAASKNVDVYIKESNAFYFAAQEAENPFYGVSYFQAAYYHWDKKVKTYFSAHLAAQRSAVGTRLGTIPQNASKAAKNEFAANIANMSISQYLMMPEGFKVESMREGGNFDFLSYLNHHNSQMSKSVLSQFLDKDQGAGKGESSVVDRGDGSNETYILMLQAIMDEIASQINHYLIPDLIDMNFKGNKYPKFTWGKFTEDQKKRISRMFEKMSVAGEALNVTPEFMRELEKTMADELGLSVDYAAVEAREEREQQAMEESYQSEAAMQAGVEEEVTLDAVEALALPGDDETTLSADDYDIIHLAQSFLDAIVEEKNHG